jgi:hypothetical protein
MQWKFAVDCRDTMWILDLKCSGKFDFQPSNAAENSDFRCILQQKRNWLAKSKLGFRSFNLGPTVNHLVTSCISQQPALRFFEYFERVPGGKTRMYPVSSGLFLPWPAGGPGGGSRGRSWAAWAPGSPGNRCMYFLLVSINTYVQLLGSLYFSLWCYKWMASYNITLTGTWPRFPIVLLCF